MIKYIISCKLHTYTENKKCKESENMGKKNKKKSILFYRLNVNLNKKKQTNRIFPQNKQLERKGDKNTQDWLT